MSGIKAFYANGMLRSAAIAMVSIFTPVFIYRLGVRQFEEIKYGIVAVAAYFLVTRLVTLIVDIPVSHIIERIGFRKSIFISIILLMTNLSVLISAENNFWLIAFSAIASGLNIPFYWVARNSAISQDGNKKQVGTQMGWMMTLEQIATILGPLTAGLVIEKWGFATMYLIAMSLIVASVLPLMSMPPHVHKNGATLKGFWYFMTNRRYFHIGVGIGSRAIDDYAISVIWPLAIFILGIKTGIMGGLFSLVSLTSLIMRMIMGKLFDKLHARKDYSDEAVFGLTAIVNAILWVLRLFVGAIGSILSIDLVGAIFGTAYSNFYIDYEQLGGMRMGNIAYWVYGEMIYSIMTIGLMILVIMGAYLSIWKELVFLSAAFWMLISTVMARESNMR